MLASSLGAPSSDLANDVLRVLREAAFFLLLTAFLEYAEAATSPLLSYKFFRTACVLGVAYLILAITQFIALDRGIYFGIPRAFFIQNGETLPTALDLRYGHQRPSGTFGEPSYFAFVLISAFVSLAPLATRWRPATIGFIAIVMAGIATKSLSFFLPLPLLGYFAFFRYVDRRYRKIVIVSSICLGVAAIGVGATSLLASRISGANNIHGDSSIFARVTGPVQILGSYLLQYPLGVPNSAIRQAVGALSESYGFQGAEVLHNATLNLFFYYGLMGLPLLFIILGSVKDDVVRIYLLSCMFFNGAFLTVDKFAIICVTVAAYFSALTALELKRAPSRRTGERSQASPGHAGVLGKLSGGA